MSFTSGRHCLGCHMSLKNCRCEEEKMTPQEANKIIAEFMGKCDFNPHLNPEKCFSCGKDYGDDIHNLNIDYMSLDALVPVWERLGKSVWLNYFDDMGAEHKAETIQEAAAIATAKAIKELANV